ncbi:MAG: c-type cytochrome [Gaiellales bacterium]
MTRLAAWTAVLAALLVGSACGGTDPVAQPGQANLANGKNLFIANCGGCHTLAEAGTKGTIGPNLDEAYLQPRLSGFDSSSFEALVREQIASPNPQKDGAAAMPPNLVTGANARDVAAYVASVAAVELAKKLKQSS